MSIESRSHTGRYTRHAESLFEEETDLPGPRDEVRPPRPSTGSAEGDHLRLQAGSAGAVTARSRSGGAHQHLAVRPSWTDAGLRGGHRDSDRHLQPAPDHAGGAAALSLASLTADHNSTPRSHLRPGRLHIYTSYEFVFVAGGGDATAFPT